jgi:hypothetical protein
MIFKDFLNKPIDIVAIEMDDMYLKLAHGTRSAGRTTISKVRTLYGKALSEEEISSSISRFFQDVKFSRGEIISVIPSRFGIYKNVEIPSIDKEEIRQIVDLQAGTHPVSQERNNHKVYRCRSVSREIYEDTSCYF